MISNYTWYHEVRLARNESTVIMSPNFPFASPADIQMYITIVSPVGYQLVIKASNLSCTNHLIVDDPVAKAEGLESGELSVCAHDTDQQMASYFNKLRLSFGGMNVSSETFLLQLAARYGDLFYQ